jgi:hypothetical protein
MKMNLRMALAVAFPFLLFIAAASCIRTPDAASAFDQAVDKLVAAGFPQALETYFCSLGTNPDLGFRWAGTTAERAVGERVAAEMRAMGLANVRLEPVPVDVFEFEKATLTVGGRTMTASTIAGVPPTPASGVTAPVVYVKGGAAADFDAAGDVAGKIVLVDMKMGSWWFSPPAFEAGHRRAAGVVCTFTPDDPKYWSADDQALGSFDGQYDLGAPPWIYVSRRDGDWLKSSLRSGPVTATLLLKEQVTLARDGGTAYNVVGELPGSTKDGQMVLFAAHQDAHFRAGADDTGALVNMLTIARAMCQSRYRPARTVVFLATAGEEFGYTNAYYEWLTGAWWAATRAHPDWAGRVRALLNLETMAIRGAPLALRSNPELKPWTERLASRHKDLLPYGAEPLTPANSWNDQWTFTAAGVPSVKFETSGENYDKLYHSNFETAVLVDYDYLGKIAKFAFRAAKELDSGPLPYSLKARADDLAAAVKMRDLVAAGADPAAAARLDGAIIAFAKAAAALDSSLATLPDDRMAPVNAGLLAVEKLVNGGLTALSPPDDDATIYPHQLVLRDLQGINAALTALKASRPERAAALQALSGVYFTRLGLVFSYSVYRKHLERLDPGYGILTWGGQGQLPKPLDVIPQYRMIEAGKATAAVADLEAKRRALIDDLNGRILRMAGVLEQAAPRIAALL